MAATANSDLLADLRRCIAAVAPDGGFRALEAPGQPVPLGAGGLDAALGGGLRRGRLHEVLPAAPGDGAAATGFTLACVARLAPRQAWLWIRQDLAGRETGEPYGPGLAAFGLDPARLVLVAAADARGVLRIAEEALRSPSLGAVLVEPWGDPRALDLTATRRLLLTAEASGVTALLLRSGAQAAPAGAATRWRVAAGPSATGPGGSLGWPTFHLTLMRCRQPDALTQQARPWTVEWIPDDRRFRDAPPQRAVRSRDAAAGSDPPPAVAPPPGTLPAAAGDGPAVAGAPQRRRAAG